MNIYKALNEVIEYIEEHLEEKIEYRKLAQILCVNEYTMQRIFSLLCNISLAEYIRRRRLSNAGFDIYQGKEKMINIALKYQYENVTSFSRAFEKFHGMKPSQVKENPSGLKIYTKLIFEEQIQEHENMEYDIRNFEKFVLWGKGIKTTNQTIHHDAPEYFSNILKEYENSYGHPQFGMVVYEDREESDAYEYWILYDKLIPNFEQYIIPAGKWLVFHIFSQEAKDIQEMVHRFYLEFLPSCKYNLKPIPELEYYHDGVTDFLIPIED